MLDPKLCIICGKHFEKGKKKDPYVQNPTIEGLQRILSLALQRDDDVHENLAPHADDILSGKIKVSYHVSCRANYCSIKTNKHEVADVDSRPTCTSEPRRLDRGATSSFNIRMDCFICGKASTRPEALTAISTGTGASTRDKVLHAAACTTFKDMKATIGVRSKQFHMDSDVLFRRLLAVSKKREVSDVS